MSSVERKLQIPDYEIVDPVVDYNPGTDPVDIPSLLIAIEHDDVEDVANNGATPRGSVVVTHWQAGCLEQIDPRPGLTSAVGEEIQDSIVATATTAATTDTGLEGDYTFTLEDGGTNNGVLTIIRYPIERLARSDTGITTTEDDDTTTEFCLRLALADGDGDDVAFRNVDVSITYNIDNLASIQFDTQEDNQGESPSADIDLGEFGTSSAFVAFDGNDFFTAAPLVFDSEASQGQALTFVVVPNSDTFINPATGDPFPFDATPELDLLALETCVLWIDSAQSNDDTVLAASGPDPGEPQLFVVEDGFPTSTVDLLDCDGRDSGQPFMSTIVPGVDFCVLTFNPTADFILPDETIVNFRCEVTMEFDGSRRRGLQGATNLVPGQQFSLSTPVTTFVLAGSNEATIESCTAGCFFLFCWFRFMSCWIMSILG